MTQSQALQNFKITEIPSASGLLYHNLGKTQLTSQSFTLLTYFNLTFIKQQIETTNSFYLKSLAICQTSEKQYNQLFCRNQLRYISTKLERIEESYRIISHQLNIDFKRHKRGLIDGIGTGLKWLFGIPNAEDAHFYSDSINALINNQKQTETLMQQQITIMSSTISNFNNSLFRVNENVKILNENLEKFNIYSTDLKSNQIKFDYELQISNHLLLLVEMTDETYSLLETYINAVSLIQHGIISYHILPPEQLFTELQKLTTKFTLPISINIETIYQYYNIITLKSFIKNNILIISFHIPLTNGKNYDLFKIFSIPIPHADDPFLYSYIEPSKSYMLISDTRIDYTAFNNLKEKCTEYQSTRWLCEKITILHRNDNQDCEIQLFSKTTTSIPNTCKTRTLLANLEIWHPLQENKWYFTVSKSTQLTVLCNDKSSESVIEKIGLLELSPNCMAYTHQAVLQASSISGQLNLTNKIPTTDITQDDCCINIKKSISENQIHLTPIKFTNLDLQELKYAQHKLNQFDEQLQQQLNKPFIIKKSNWFTLLASLIGGAVVLIILYNLLKWCGFIQLIRKYCCFTREPQHNAICYPCIQLFNQCHDTPTSNPISVHYDNRLQGIPTTSAEPDDIEVSSSTNLRRSKRLRGKVTINSN